MRYCREPGIAVIRLTGTDAIPFLHAQTTQKLDDLLPQQTRSAAWLSARGRVLALFDVVADGGDLLLLLPADNADFVVTGFKRFVLRAKLGIVRDDSRAVWSLTGAIDDALAALGIAVPVGAAAPVGEAIVARVATGLAIVVGAQDRPPAVLSGGGESAADAAAAAAIAAGRAEIPAALRELYVPQMLNLEKLGAVSFTKGCYPGQEIVARTQNLGTVKRRPRRLRAPAGARPAAGDPIVDTAGAVVGEVNRVAASGAGFELLAVVGIEAGDALRLAADGRPLEKVGAQGA